MNDQANSSRDPYELDRLAEELVTRERSHYSEDAADGRHELPVYVPLKHGNPYLTADAFDIEQFLLSRSYTSLQDLRAELRDYLATLKEELVKLINDDYEAFISLSTDLRDEGARLGKLKAPLDVLRTEIQTSKSELEATQVAIQDKLETRAVLREEKALLHLLLKISELVTRLEGLLLIGSPDGDATPIDTPNVLVSPPLDSIDDNRGNQAKHLSRVAAEYTQLLYHAAKAREHNCAFVDEMQWRIDRIQSTLSSDLDHHFSSLLVSLTEGAKHSELDKSKISADLKECLRTYDTLGLWRDAEDIVRRDIVRRFVRKTIFSGALAAPASPLVPHTPFHATGGPSHPPPKTPYTPFTALPKSFLSSASSKGQNPYMAMLEDIDEPLAKLYCQILRFVERDLSGIMNMAEHVSIKAYPTPNSPNTAAPVPITVNAFEETKGFQLMANVVWDEFGRGIMDELGHAVFSVGKPNIFRKHYDITQVFIRSLEWLAPSEHAVAAMRAHPTYTSFERRWQLPVYFQMRWKELVTALEDSLVSLKMDPVARRGSGPHFVTAQASAVYMAISKCWHDEIYIRELGHRFWRLTLQLISRYKTWTVDSFTTLDRKPAQGVNNGSPSRPGTPIQSPSAQDSDDVQLIHCTAVVLDIGLLRLSVMDLWRDQISRMLPANEEGEEAELAENQAVLEQSLTQLTELIPNVEARLVSIIAKHCSEALGQIRSIPTQFRSERSKRPVDSPSKFVPEILKPLKTFIGENGLGGAFPVELRESITRKVFERVLQRYHVYIIELKKIEDPLRRLKKNKKPAFSLFGNANPGKEEEDDERIKSQMILDVDSFGKDAHALGVPVESNETFKALHGLVRTFDKEQ
ncbi:COG complex component [Cylindrobasidium torrendii FP15055 ss-10]|uniref:Conserved oligomeric Golgi complex subunit 2 n=1 Tax=Cylindrobasidium torrendii FP15055 ss-10 TaxID=1314674 RepID=A0A0D7BTY8_9AGAR|nr:COG complex component [Cylindrobasidium torrendii FP15055 ss-10]